MGTLWYGTLVKLGDLQKLLTYFHIPTEYQHAVNTFNNLDEKKLPLGFLPENDQWESSFENMQDVVQFFNQVNILSTSCGNLEVKTCGRCCRQDYNKRYIVGFSTDGIDSRGDSCVSVKIPTDAQQTVVRDFCELYNLPNPDFYLNGEECYVCGH
jgi:hypothetical protein